MKQDNSGLVGRRVVVPAVLVAGFTTGACREYTCQDTASCAVPVADAGGTHVATSADVGDSGEANPTSGSSPSPTTAEAMTGNSQGAPTSESEDTDPASEADASVDSTSSEPNNGDTSADSGAASSPDGIDSTTSDNGETKESGEGQTTAPDETIPEVRCDPAKPFGRPFAIAAINLHDEVENVMLAPDGLTAYIRYGADLTTYVSTRGAIFESFTTPIVHAAFDSILEDEPTLQLRAITEDKLTVYLSDEWTAALPIRSAHRSDPTKAFSQLIVHEELTAFDISLAQPWVSPDGERLYTFVPAGYTLWTASAQDFGFSTPIEVEGIGSITSFALSTSELVLYYGVHDGAHNGAIFRSVRSAIGQAFEIGDKQASLDGPNYDTPLWGSDDDCEIILMQENEVSEGSGTYTSDIFIARRGL